VIEARGLSYAAGGRTILRDISAAFAPSCLHFVIGPNGAGKSTLVKLLARLLRPRSGVVLYDGADVAARRESELARRRAVLSQAIEIAFPLAVHEVVMMGRYPHFGTRPVARDAAVIDEVMRFCDVADLAERDYSTLSGGERQRVHFARVLAQIWVSPPSSAAEGPTSPAPGRFLFLDEPLTFLDIGHQLDLLRKLRGLGAAPDLTVVAVLHDLALAARFADSLVLLDRGAVLAAGTVEEVMTPAHVRTAFGVEPVILPAADGRRHLVFE
jgi:iron complex transport system ATP-binding protein